jgi:hypothetical protein
MNDLNAREKQVDKSSSAESGFFMTYDKNEWEWDFCAIVVCVFLGQAETTTV